MEKLFPEITSFEEVMRLARGGAIAGVVFAALVLFDAVFGSAPVLLPGVRLAGAGLEAAFILALSWRVWSGRNFVSAIALMALLVLATLTGIRDGMLGLAWMAAYFGLGLMMLNAIRACLRHDVYSDETAKARAA